MKNLKLEMDGIIEKSCIVIVDGKPITVIDKFKVTGLSFVDVKE